MKRALLVLTIAALALPAAALGKGPSGASIDGPGAGGGITLGGDGESPGTPLGDLTDQSGFFPAVFARRPDPMLDTRPNGDLGPKYTVVWTVPGPNNETWKLRQDVYPYATPAPVTYMEPGQEIFETPGGTRGGWFQGDARLKETLVSAGLPAQAAGVSGGGNAFSSSLLSLLAAAMLLMSATAVVLRRRTRPTPAA
jgi:hypothetical protein